MSLVNKLATPLSLLIMIAAYLILIFALAHKPVLDWWWILLISIQSNLLLNSIWGYIRPNKKRNLKKGRIRLQKHIDERKELIRKIRESWDAEDKKYGKPKVTIFGYPWWPGR
ncbi:hypothetical protein ACUXVT_11535 [Acinetobacter soli]|uniref:hypothetical protein n=1 Tax=Acinetobacter soli TaxID=487316 RepID=UPI0040562251